MTDRELREKLVEWIQSAHYGLWSRAGAGDRWRRWSKEPRQAVSSGEEGAGANPEAAGREESGQARFVYGEPLEREALLLYPAEEKLDEDAKDRLRSIIREEWLEELVLQQQREHEQWLRGLREITSSLDLNELLLRIMHNALTVLPSADCGFFMMYDPESGKLEPRASVGIGESIYEFRVAPGEGITGKVFNGGKGEIYASAPSFAKAMDNVSMNNMDNLSRAFNHSPENVQAAMAVPVTMNKDKIGVMIVHQLRKEKGMDERDLFRLQGFADQAAIAISNARMYSELEEKNRYLTKRNEIHDIFTKLSVEGNDLETVTRTMSRMLGLSVFFVDLAKDEWYPPLGGGSELTGDRLRRLFAGLATSRTIEDSYLGSCYLYPILNGSVLLGSFVVKLERALGQLDSVVLEQGSAVVALEMLNTYSLTEMIGRGNQELFGDILLNREPKMLEAKLKGFGLNRHAHLFVCILQLEMEHPDPKRRESDLRRLISGIEKEVGRSNLLLFGAQDKVTILAAADDEAKQKKFLEKLRAAAARWSDVQASLLFGGAGGLYKGLENVAKSNDEANRSLSYVRGRERAEIMRYGDIGINRLFINQNPEEIDSYVRDVLAPLRSHRGQSGELERTLKTYMAANRASALTADRLHIHPNTLYHRLRKIEELLGVDLDEPDDWLKIYLACHLSDA